MIKMVQILRIPKIPGALHASNIPAKLIHGLDAMVWPAVTEHAFVAPARQCLALLIFIFRSSLRHSCSTACIKKTDGGQPWSIIIKQGIHLCGHSLLRAEFFPWHHLKIIGPACIKPCAGPRLLRSPASRNHAGSWNVCSPEDLAHSEDYTAEVRSEAGICFG